MPTPTRRSRHTIVRALALLIALAWTWGCGPSSADDARVAPAELLHVDDPAPAHVDHPTALSSDAPLPGASLYHLDADWTDHRGEALRLEDLRGGPVIVTMIYASCETACPILVGDVQRLYEALPDAARADTQVLVVSFDHERDAPERLASYVASTGTEHPAWRFAVGDAHATRALAALLGVRYRPAGNGMFSHTNLISVLDGGGVVVHSEEGLGRPVEPAVRAVVAAGEPER
ncbi:MAG: SCO family protein [Trueperaceae bacterium]|nr:SCO family protein [Trueperaceae bacterium]